MLLTVHNDREGANIPFVLRSVDIKLRLTEVCWDAVRGDQQRSSGVVTNVLDQLVELWLVAQSPAIDLIVYPRSLRPRLALVVGLPDGNIPV